ncbi:hypothetical protein O181_013353 [Austropuccinia psidii MF-1]|uniref:Uncharacterized protein n=1 Tax=Austropuccinia psidii MF-1 TaxID=1389203 RepID=A0A9Q3BZ23_9BASI|nr:hypothetical protein [Austropuccinia psidii MF-1]
MCANPRSHSIRPPDSTVDNNDKKTSSSHSNQTLNLRQLTTHIVQVFSCVISPVIQIACSVCLFMSIHSIVLE